MLRSISVSILGALLCAAVALALLPARADAALHSGPVAIFPLPPPPPVYPDHERWSRHRLCELSNDAQAILNRTAPRFGLAVVDLVAGRLWTGGDAQPFALHSVVKTPIAWMTLAAAEARGETLSPQLAEQLRSMISWSSNDAVQIVLDYAGGMPALRDFYAALELDGLVAHFNRFSWGRSAGAPADVAAAYAQLATSPDFSPAVRKQGFALLEAVQPEQRWGATTPPAALAGWSALVKTGQFAIEDEGLRINSAAIWLDEWRRPRYVIAMMSAEQRHWGLTMQRQTKIGGIIAAAIAAREDPTAPTTGTCPAAP